MSFDLVQLGRLQQVGGAVLTHYERLLREANQSAHGSPAEQALGEFQLAWIADPERVTREAEEKAQSSVSPSAEDAAPARRRSRSSVSEKGEAL
jgi:hypothetical protein